MATLLVGDNIPGGGAFYAMREGDATVYLLSATTANHFVLRKLDFVDNSITETIQYVPEITRAVLSGHVRPEPIVIEGVEVNVEDDPLMLNTHFIVSPVQRRLHGHFGFGPLVQSYGLIGNKVEAFLESPDELRTWNLDEPYSTLEIVSSTHESFKLMVSAPNEYGVVYLVRENVPFVYSIDSHMLPWLELTFFDMMDPLLILPAISTVSRLEIHLSDRIVNITFEDEGDELEVFVDDVPYEAQEGVDSVRNFVILYQNFLSTRYESIPDEPMPEGTPILLQFTYHYRDGSPSDTVTIFEGAARRVFFQLNDETPMLGLSSFVDHLLGSIEGFLAGELVVSYL
jgi:hypothetical protein